MLTWFGITIYIQQEVPGLSVSKALAASLPKPGVWTLPQVYLKAGSTLLVSLDFNVLNDMLAFLIFALWYHFSLVSPTHGLYHRPIDYNLWSS